MARRLPLLIVKGCLPNGGGPLLDFDYGDMFEALLRHAPQGKGLNLDEVIRCVAAIGTLDAARKARAEEVKFPEEEWRTLREKLDGFTFAFADKVIADFGLAIRQAEEIT
jgi:hypothetical protein